MQTKPTSTTFPLGPVCLFNNLLLEGKVVEGLEDLVMCLSDLSCWEAAGLSFHYGDLLKTWIRTWSLPLTSTVTLGRWRLLGLTLLHQHTFHRLIAFPKGALSLVPSVPYLRQEALPSNHLTPERSTLPLHARPQSLALPMPWHLPGKEGYGKGCRLRPESRTRERPGNSKAEIVIAFLTVLAVQGALPVPWGMQETENHWG